MDLNSKTGHQDTSFLLVIDAMYYTNLRAKTVSSKMVASIPSQQSHLKELEVTPTLGGLQSRPQSELVRQVPFTQSFQPLACESASVRECFLL